MGNLRKDNNIPLNFNNDSEYKDIVREDRVFPNLLIPKVYSNVYLFSLWKELYLLNQKIKSRNKLQE